MSKSVERRKGSEASKRSWYSRPGSMEGDKSMDKSTEVPYFGPPELRILLFGRCGSRKTSAGNTILGQNVFKAGQRSARCEVKYGEVAERRLIVVDSPGWFYNSLVQDSSEMDKLEMQKSVRLCAPGPHAVLLAVPLDGAFTNAHRVAVEEHMTLLSQSAWSHTLILFTCGDLLGDTSIEQHIERRGGEDLRWLLDKCGNRYHVFNNEKRDDTQVTQLLEKIKGMVSGNAGGHYEVDRDVAEQQSRRRKNIRECVKTFRTMIHRTRMALKALFEGEHQRLPDVRVMLVGGRQNGRITAGCIILQKELQIQTKLTECVRQQSQVADRNVSVVTCPDWSTTPPSRKTKDVLLHGVTLCSPGPHAVLVTVDVRSSFSEAERRSVEEHMELLGDRVWRHALVLFTWGWWLGGRRVEKYIESEGEPLRWLLEKCGYRYDVLDFSMFNMSAITELMEKIEDIVTRNRGYFGPLDSREGRSDRDTGLFGVRAGARQMSFLERLTTWRILTVEEWNSLEKREQEWKRREEEWRRREEEMIERMVTFMVRRRNSMDQVAPSMSDDIPSEQGIHFTDLVSDWLQRYTITGPGESTDQPRLLPASPVPSEMSGPGSSNASSIRSLRDLL